MANVWTLLSDPTNLVGILLGLAVLMLFRDFRYVFWKAFGFGVAATTLVYCVKVML